MKTDYREFLVDAFIEASKVVNARLEFLFSRLYWLEEGAGVERACPIIRRIWREYENLLYTVMVNDFWDALHKMPPLARVGCGGEKECINKLFGEFPEHADESSETTVHSMRDFTVISHNGYSVVVSKGCVEFDFEQAVEFQPREELVAGDIDTLSPIYEAMQHPFIRLLKSIASFMDLAAGDSLDFSFSEQMDKFREVFLGTYLRSLEQRSFVLPTDTSVKQVPKKLQVPIVCGFCGEEVKEVEGVVDHDMKTVVVFVCPGCHADWQISTLATLAGSKDRYYVQRREEPVWSRL